MHPFALLTAAQTRQAEEQAHQTGSHAGGMSKTQMMEHAGASVVQLIEHLVQEQIKAENAALPEGQPQKEIKYPPVAILCGPGNNGGDGFVVARLLAEKKWDVRVGLLGDRSKLSGDAAMMSKLYEGEVRALSPKILEGTGLVIDAIFGTGLSRPLEGPVLDMVRSVNAYGAPVIAVDIPTGIHTDSGAILGDAVQANRTLTFITRKPGHVLYPGRRFCGQTDIAGIGISDQILSQTKPHLTINDIGVWGARWPRPGVMTHKFDRGWVSVLSGGVSSTGAARLAARGALRIGAGIVKVLSPPSALMVNASQLTSIMAKSIDGVEALAEELADPRLGSVVAGPGLASASSSKPDRSEELKAKIAAVLGSSAIAILDADALSGFADAPQELFKQLRPDDILTPHGGEFSKLFPDINVAEVGRLEAGRLAAKKCGAVVVFKGADTIIASPDGIAGINVNATPDLATAGSGDVLAGFIAGLVSARVNGKSVMTSFDAAMAGVWLHGAAAQVAGPGLIAEDLPEKIPELLAQIFAQNPQV